MQKSVVKKNILSLFGYKIVFWNTICSAIPVILKMIVNSIPMKIKTFPSHALILLAVLMLAFSSCKSKKKLTEISDAKVVSLPPEDVPYDEPEEPERKAVNEPTRNERLTDYFRAIAGASSVTSANNSIQEALRMFSASSAPVLIIIYSANGQNDYDEPTTIANYLNYLKDTKNAAVMVEEMVLDDNGKIKELVLRKK